MASLIDNLITTLTQENEEYEQMLELSLRKTEVIVNSDREKLMEIVEQEQAFIERIDELEKIREETMNDISIVINHDVKELTLSKLAELLSGQPKESNELNIVHDKLSATLSRMVNVNETNKALLKESLEMIQFEMNLIQSYKQGPATANYSGNTYADQTEINTSFDAKQ